MSKQARSRVRSALPFVAAGGLAVGGAVLARQRRSAPQREIITAAGGPVTITRDERGVPHIIAASRDDALFGLGYAMACDRLFQLDLVRRAATGRLAEIAGPNSLPADRLMRLVGIDWISERLASELAGEQRAAVESLAAGINHRITSGRLPAEFRITRQRPAPWQPADSLAAYRLMAWSLGNFYESDLVAERVRGVIGNEWTAAIFDCASPTDPLIVRETAGPVGESRVASPDVFPSTGGSNGWAVAGARSTTGAPLLANDPHLEYLNPSVWYEATLEAPGFTVHGVTMPGFLGIGIGRTPTLAWGLTSAMISQTFLYREKLNEAGTHYRDRDGWQPLEITDELINVRGQQPEVLRIRATSRGPLISDLRPDLCDDPVSLYWTGREPSGEVETLLQAGAARSIEELANVRHIHAVPVFNAVAAETGGGIGALTVGRLPIRTPRCGLLDPADDFPPRYVPPYELPREVNPARGWVLVANNRIVGDDYPYEMHGLWAMDYRARRIADVLEGNPQSSLEDMRALQLDVYSVEAAELVPLLLELLGDAVPSWTLADLAGWDYQVTADSRPALIWEMFLREWTRAALEQRLPTDIVEQITCSARLLTVPNRFVTRLLRGELPEWLDDGARRELAREAFARALVATAATLGTEPAKWTWGAIHALTFTHPLGELPGPQRRHINVGPFPVGGDSNTVNPGAWLAADPFNVIAGASMRFLADLSRPFHAVFTNTLGQHGSPLGRHYRDQTAAYLAADDAEVVGDQVDAGRLVRLRGRLTRNGKLD
jgi:penicillin amidase